MGFRIDEKITLDIRTTNAKVNIVSERPTMNVKTIKAEMKVERRPASYNRVQKRRVVKKARRSQPQKSHSMISNPVKEIAQRIISDKNSKRIHVLENNISKLSPGADPINGINAQIMEDGDRDETHMVWDPGFIRTTWTRPRMIVEWEIKRPKITVEPHSVKITPRRKGSVRADYRPKILKMANRIIDKKV